MFNNQEQIKKFINGQSFVTEEKDFEDVENSTKKDFQLQLIHFNIVSDLAITNGENTQTTIPEVSIIAEKHKKRDFSKKIQTVREDFRLTQEECADILGVSLGTLQNIESNTLGRHRDTVLKVVSFTELVKQIRDNVKQKYILKTIFHSKLGVFGNRTALEFVRLLPKDKRLNEVSAILKKIYE